ncbi:MAG: hypothetical protein JW959_02735, partial [Pirellulales bacterium]|nr:hypothetical protein [Pirellulales bacterium]
ARTLFRGKTKLVRASTHPTVVFRNRNELIEIIGVYWQFGPHPHPLPKGEGTEKIENGTR